MDEAFNDPRFGHIVSDPKFKKPPTFKRKVKIDKRFQRMFKDENFQVKYTVDKRGKPVNQSSVENYGKFYALSDDDDDDDDSEEGSASDSSSSGVGGKSIENKLVESRKKIKKKVNDTKLSTNGEKKGGKTKKSKVQIKKNKEIEDGSDSYHSNDDDEAIGSDDKEEAEDDSEEEEESCDDESDDDIPNEVKEKALKTISQKRKLPKEIKEKLHDMSIDYARGVGVLTDSSSSDDSGEDISAGEEEEDVEHDWGELDKDADRTDSATERLAICNMDWDRIRAVDLMVLCSSFLPSGGLVKSVSIYPSEFGLKRMKEEEVRGPLEIVEQKKLEPELDLEMREDEDEEGNKYHMEQLRKYQLLRLKYYYAIVVCDSADTASTLYNECDGLEYESSATRLDLRFVPDDVTFDEEPRDVCTKLPEINKYQPRLFLNTALQQGKVECTWDETDPERVKLAQKLHQIKGDDGIDDKELKMFLASSEEEDENEDNKDEEKKDDNSGNDDDKDSCNANNESSDDNDSDSGVKNNSIDKYRNLLTKIQEDEEKKKNRDVEMEITWGVGLKEKTQAIVDKKLKESTKLTPFEKMIEKKKEKKKLKKKERMKLVDQDDNAENEKDDDSDDYSDDEIPDGIDMNDDYFKEELEGFSSKNGIKNKTKKHKNKQSDSDSDNEEESTRNANELELLFMDEKGEETKKKHFNLKSIMENEDESKKKKKKGRKQLIKNKKKEEHSAIYEDDFKIDVTDDRFNALYSSHHFNIDPADSHFRKTKGIEALIHEKLNRKNNDGNRNSPLSGNETKNVKNSLSSNDDRLHNPAKRQKLENTKDLQQMVNSIKRNTQFSKTKR